MTRSSGSGMRDLPCAGPEFSCIFSSRVSAPTLKRVLTTGQEEHNKPESSAAKLYCLHLQEQERKTPSPKNESPLLTSLGARAPARQSAERALLFTSLGASEQAPEPEREWRKPRPL